MKHKFVELTCPHCQRKEMFSNNKDIQTTTAIKCLRCKGYYELEGNTKYFEFMAR